MAALHLFKCPVAVTLTMKLRANGQSNDHITASSNFKHFMNRLGAKSLRSAAKRHGRKLRVFAVLEQNAEGRLHYHAIIDRPLNLPVEKFAAFIREQWTRSNFGYRKIDIKEQPNAGWLSYMFKSRQKGGCLLDSIDWANCTPIPG